MRVNNKRYSYSIRIGMWLMATLLMGYTAIAQQASEDFKKLAEKTRNRHRAVKINYEMYSQHNGGNKVQSKHAICYMWDNMLSYTMDGVILITNSRFTLSVDNEKKTIVLNKYNAAFQNKLEKEALKFNMDSLLAKYSQTTLISHSDTQRTWRVNYKKPVSGISYIDLVIQLSDYSIQKAILYYARSFSDIYGSSPKMADKKDKPRLEVMYMDYWELTEEDKQKFFSAEQILSIDKKGNITPAAQYKNYQIANYYNLKK